MEPITGKRILVTGVTGWVAGPLAAQLAAAGNTVYGAARLADPAQREALEAKGVVPTPLDLGAPSLADVPAVDLVLHLAVSKSGSFAEALAANADGSANLLAAAKAANPALEAFFHCSSTAVYQPAGHAPLTEDAPLGDSHRSMGMTTYSISKIAGEVLVRHTARRLGVPTVIARLNVPYGDTYGWMLFHLMMMERGMAVPVHTDAPTSFTPIHADDIAASIPYLLSLASPEVTAVNWGGDEVASVEEWCAELGALTGLTPTFAPTEATIPAIVPDLSLQRSTGFRTTVGWRDGMRRLVATSRPDLLKS